ncbi:HEPN domain-containing protein [Microbacterium hydrocarbonoxydans]|uniref:HEPN domain-containing protein n=1 Tax=Microbacterium hydrocarbonoxydans TaxID=273678 RepID=UPI0039C9EDC4
MRKLLPLGTRLRLNNEAQSGPGAVLSRHEGRREAEAAKGHAWPTADDEEERSWLCAKIRNGPTYRDRLSELASTPDEFARATVIDDVNLWVKNLVRARNALAHTSNFEGDANIFDLEQ